MRDLLDRDLRHLFVLAHFDDDLGYGGLLSRLSGSVDVVYLTNGDGIAPEVGADPAEYAAMRTAESRVALGAAGIGGERLRHLGYSEIEIYDRLVDVTACPGEFGAIAAYFRRMAGVVAAEVDRVRPDVLWTCAYQQGHPEHDLAHVMAATALRARRPGATLCGLPQYELTILVPLRFPPWRREGVQAVELTPAEVDVKRRMRDAYPSQAKLFRSFERVINGIGLVGRLAGRGFDFDGYVSRETYAVVPPRFDYLTPAYALDPLNYMFERHRGIKVSFQHHLRPVVAALLAGGIRPVIAADHGGADGLEAL
ncbi:MAG TPA: PIG-L family deacetylase [Polyangia bacterium]|jgi:LmbE family N-acetylglucosaminyl deacetylase